MRGRIENNAVLVSLCLLSLSHCCGRIHYIRHRFAAAHRAWRRGFLRHLRHHCRPCASSIHRGGQTLRRRHVVRRIRASAFFRRALLRKTKLWPGLRPKVCRAARVGWLWHGHGFGNAGGMGIWWIWPSRFGAYASLPSHLDIYFKNDVSTLSFSFIKQGVPT